MIITELCPQGKRSKTTSFSVLTSHRTVGMGRGSFVFARRHGGNPTFSRLVPVRPVKTFAQLCVVPRLLFQWVRREKR